MERGIAMLNALWAGMMLVGIVYGAVQGRLAEITNAALDSSKEAISLCITMLGVMAFWMGIMEIATKAGVIDATSRWMAPVVRYFFPNIPKGHPAPSAGIPPASAAQPQVSAPAPASASSYKEADERVKQIQGRQKDIDRQIHSLVSSVDWFGDKDTPEAKQALSQIAKLRSDYAKLNDDLGSAIKERAALKKTTDHPNFTHAITGRSENEITSLAWEREQKRRHRNFMANTFGGAS